MKRTLAPENRADRKSSEALPFFLLIRELRRYDSASSSLSSTQLTVTRLRYENFPNRRQDSASITYFQDRYTRSCSLRHSAILTLIL